MILGGFEKNSLIDFPPHISSVIFAQGCNFHCPYCHNPDLVAGYPHHLSPNEDDVFAFLQKRRSYIDAVVISGGEPTLHSDIADFCDRIKQLGYFIKIDTNGSRPEVIKQLVTQNLVDYIAMDIKTDPGEYSPHFVMDMDPICVIESIRIIQHSKLSHEFRTTCIRPFIDESTIFTISKLVQGSPRFFLQRPRLEQVLDPEFFTSIDPMYDETTLRHFCHIISAAVGSCKIR